MGDIFQEYWTLVSSPIMGKWLMRSISAARLARLLGEVTTVSREPSYIRVATQIRMLIGDGRLAIGVRLPAERDLAATLRCSRTLVAGAYRRLREHGWAYARRGSGTWTRIPDRPGLVSGTWAPIAGESDIVDLAHVAAEAPPEFAVAVAGAAESLPRELPRHGYHPGGMLELRTRIAERYTARGFPTTADHIAVTNGALHAFTVILAVLAGPGDRVLVEHPTYPNALDAIADAGCRPVPVADGVDPVRELVCAASQTSPRMAYVIPDFHNPTGRLLDSEQRERLARRLSREGVITVVDETFVDVDIDAEPPAPLGVHDPAERTVTIGTLSKSVWGGLRLGWTRSHPDLAERIRSRIVRTQLASPVMEQLTACYLLDVLDSIRERRRPQLRAQRDDAIALLGEYFPEWTVISPLGGLCLWCRLDAPVSTALAATASMHRLRLAAGPRFGTGHSFDDYLRIPFNRDRDALAQAFALLTTLTQQIGSATAPPQRLIV